MKRIVPEQPDARAAMEARLDRRTVVVGGSAVITGLAALGVSSADAAEAPEKMFLQPGDRIQLIEGAAKDENLRPELLTVGEKPVQAFPFDPTNNVLRRGNRLNRLLALRLDPAEMDDETRGRSIDGVLVYSALCTHRNCTIDSWMPEERFLRCHCHLSQFAALSAGSVTGGPARRQLPMVPIGLDADGFVAATEGFTRPPGGAKT